MLKSVLKYIKEWQPLFIYIATLVFSIFTWLLKDFPYINFLFMPISLNIALLFLLSSSLIFITLIADNYVSGKTNKSRIKKVAREFKEKWNDYTKFMCQYNDFKDQPTLNKYLYYRDWFINNLCALEDALIKYISKIKQPMKIGYEQTIISNIKSCYHYDNLPEQKQHEASTFKPKEFDKLISEFCSSVANF